MPQLLLRERHAPAGVQQLLLRTGDPAHVRDMHGAQTTPHTHRGERERAREVDGERKRSGDIH